jgi:hypothetical protein
VIYRKKVVILFIKALKYGMSGTKVTCAAGTIHVYFLQGEIILQREAY